LGLPILLYMAEYTGRVTKLSEGLGIPKPTLSSWVSRGIIPKEAMADNSPLPVCKAILDHKDARIRELEAKLARQDGDALYHQKVRIATAQAEKEEIELAELIDQLHNSQEMARSLINLFATFKSTMLSWEGVVAPHLVGLPDVKTAMEVLRPHILEALEELSKYDPDSDRSTGDLQTEQQGFTEAGFTDIEAEALPEL